MRHALPQTLFAEHMSVMNTVPEELQPQINKRDAPIRKKGHQLDIL